MEGRSLEGGFRSRAGRAPSAGIPEARQDLHLLLRLLLLAIAPTRAKAGRQANASPATGFLVLPPSPLRRTGRRNRELREGHVPQSKDPVLLGGGSGGHPSLVTRKGPEEALPPKIGRAISLCREQLTGDQRRVHRKGPALGQGPDPGGDELLRQVPHQEPSRGGRHDRDAKLEPLIKLNLQGGDRVRLRP